MLAVTKAHPPQTIQEASSLGIKCFGENKVQEAEEKKEYFPNDSELHLIGHLQSNKIKRAIKIFNVIQTIDSYKLAEKINNKAKEINKKQRIFCQINIGEDPKKTGFSKEEAIKEIPRIIKLSNIKLEGIMTILPIEKNKEERKSLFNKTRKIKNEISSVYKIKLELSMGMSGDYKEAIECGSTQIRVGSKLFGKRK